MPKSSSPVEAEAAGSQAVRAQLKLRELVLAFRDRTRLARLQRARTAEEAHATLDELLHPQAGP